MKDVGWILDFINKVVEPLNRISRDLEEIKETLKRETKQPLVNFDYWIGRSAICGKIQGLVQGWVYENETLLLLFEDYSTPHQ